MITIKNVNINLDNTITCGQIFRYKKENDNSYTVILSDRVINIKKENNNLIVKSNNENNLEQVVIDYFDLEKDYDSLNMNIFKKNEDLKEIIDYCNGLKIINQPKFECLISYILSSNNGVNQIRSVLNNIAFKYGKEIIFEDVKYYLFPNSKDLENATIDDFKSLKAGFRAEYLYEIINKINTNKFDLNSIDNMNSIDATNYLMQNKGIGEKIASCILLFSYSRLDVFPIDTWVKKYMKDTYGIQGISNIQKFAKDRYDNYTGLVIQYMFNYKRNKS